MQRTPTARRFASLRTAGVPRAPFDIVPCPERRSLPHVSIILERRHPCQRGSMMSPYVTRRRTYIIPHCYHAQIITHAQRSAR